MNACTVATVVNNKGYAIDWRDVVRPSVLKRDGYKCMHCGLSNRTLYTWENKVRIILDDDWLLKRYQQLKFKILKITLQIAHQCNNKACVNEFHLITLCDSCHLRLDKHTHVITRLSNAAKKKSL
jgi:hypothetical protein